MTDLSERLVQAAMVPLAPTESGYWAPTEKQTRSSVAAVLRVLAEEYKSDDFGPAPFTGGWLDHLAAVVSEHPSTPRSLDA